MEQVAQKIPEDRRVLPAPQILGPILEGIRYEPEDTPIAEMFANLLGSAMDTEKLDGVFPHFSLIIKQLSPDEASILHYLKANLLQSVHYNTDTNLKADPNNFYIIDKIQLIAPVYISIYIDHLFYLGLIFWDMSLQYFDVLKERDVSMVFARLSPMGEQFMAVCSPTPRPGSP